MKHTYITARYGELSTTKPDLVARLLSDSGDAWIDVNGVTYPKSTKWHGVLSYDNWMPVDGLKYGVCEVDLPEGLDPDVYLANEVQFKYLWGMCPRATSLPVDFQLALINNISDATNRCIIADLAVVAYGRGFRSQFRESIWNQVYGWLFAGSNNRKHDFPLSRRQMDAISKPNYHYDRLASRVYSNI